MSDIPTLSEVMQFIKFIIYHCDDGLAVLLGQAAPPTAVDIYNMQHGAQADYGCRIDGGEDVPKSQVILESKQEELIIKLGGWNSITRAFEEFRANYPETWMLFEMASIFIRPGGMVRDGKGGATEMISRHYDGITPKTLRRRRDRFIRAIALFLITRPNGEMRLYDDTLISKRLN